MPEKLILFDVDGTLIDTAGAGRTAMERAFREVFGADGFEDAEGVEFAGRTDPTIFDAVARVIGIEAPEYDRRRDELVQRFFDALAAEMQRPDARRRTLPGVRTLLEKLQDHPRAHLGLLTGNMERGARIKLEPFDLNRFFPDGGFGSDDADRAVIARIARDKLAVLTGIDFPAHDVTVVGDTHHDVACARANGFRAVALDTGWIPRETLERAGPDVLLPGLEDPRVFAALDLEG